MGFGESIKHVFSNMTNFSGRASRSEFWWFYLFTVIIGLILSIIVNTTGSNSASDLGINIITFVVYVILILATLPASSRSGYVRVAAASHAGALREHRSSRVLPT